MQTNPTISHIKPDQKPDQVFFLSFDDPDTSIIDCMLPKTSLRGQTWKMDIIPEVYTLTPPFPENLSTCRPVHRSYFACRGSGSCLEKSAFRDEWVTTYLSPLSRGIAKSCGLPALFPPLPKTAPLFYPFPHRASMSFR